MLKAISSLILVLIFAQLSAQEKYIDKSLNIYLSPDPECYQVFSKGLNTTIKVAHLKTTSEDSIDLDSTITEIRNVDNSGWENEKKMEFLYNQLKKNTSEILYLWDTSINEWVNSEKNEYEYDSYGYRCGSAKYFWDSSISKWIGTEKFRIKFDSIGNWLLYENFTWNSGDMNWIVTSEIEYLLDSTGRTVSRINSSFYNNQKMKTHETIFTYDSLGNLTSEVQWLYNANSGNWEAYSRFENEFDLAGHCIVKVYSEWNSSLSTWTYIKREENTYNNSGNKDTTFVKFWDESTGDWLTNLKYELQYDENENVILVTTCNWSASPPLWTCNGSVEYNYNWDNKLINKTKGGWDYEGHWYGIEKEDYSYDSFGNKTLKLRFEYSFNTNNWINVSKQIFKYDSIGNMTYYSSYNYDIPNGKFIPSAQYEYSFNNNYLLNELTLPNSIIDNIPDFLSMPVQTITSYRLGTDFAPYRRMNYYFQNEEVINTSNSIPLSLPAVELSVFPNPGNDFIKIKLNTPTDQIYLQMYNLNGSEVKSLWLLNNNPLDVKDLNRGFYFLKINYGSKIYHGKIILE